MWRRRLEDSGNSNERKSVAALPKTLIIRGTADTATASRNRLLSLLFILHLKMSFWPGNCWKVVGSQRFRTRRRFCCGGEFGFNKPRLKKASLTFRCEVFNFEKLNTSQGGALSYPASASVWKEGGTLARLGAEAVE